MPSPWNDRARFYESAGYLDGYCEKVLSLLTEYLNDVCYVSHDRSFWRILLGPWLLQHLHGVYDRYVHLTDAFSQHPELQTIMLASDSFQVPRDTAEYSTLRRGDTYRLQLATQLLSGMGFSFPSLSLTDSGHGTKERSSAARTSWLSTFRRARNWGLRFSERSLSSTINRLRGAAVYDLDLPRSQIWRLAYKTGFRAIPSGLRNEWSFTLPDPIFDRRRNDLAGLPATNEFERLFLRSLPENLPTLYLEGFQSAMSETLSRYRKIPSVVISDVGWYFNEPFKFLAGQTMAEDGRLVAGQHGGSYGVLRFVPFELHESRLSDSFLVWGWGPKDTTAYRNLPSPKLSSLYGDHSSRHSVRKVGEILFVSAPYRPYVNRLHSCPVGSQWEEYVEWQIRFLTACSDHLRSSLLFRSRPGEDGWSVKDRILDRFPDIRWDSAQPFHQSLKRSRIAVIDNPVTTFLEALAANVPLIMFRDPSRWEVRQEAEPYMQSLRNAGILWDSPEEAAAKVDAIREDPWLWWGSVEVQDTRLAFADRYALARKDWGKQWAEALKEEFILKKHNNA